jgi:ribosomal protein S1
MPLAHQPVPSGRQENPQRPGSHQKPGTILRVHRPTPPLRQGNPQQPGQSSIHQKIPQKGEVFRGKVLEVGEKAVVIQVEDFDAEQVVGVMRAETIAGNDTSRYQEGNDARVEVIDVRKKDARIILELKPAPRKK